MKNMVRRTAFTARSRTAANKAPAMQNIGIYGKTQAFLHYFTI